MEIKNCFKELKEQTYTLPSGIHLGHYKALLAPDENNKECNNTQSDAIWEIIHAIINASIQIRNGPDRWKTINQIMLEKMKGNNNIKNLDE